MNEWQYISTAPKDGTIILLGWIRTEESSPPQTGHWWGEEWYEPKLSGEPIVCDYGASRPPTHWMSLPESPTMNEEDDE